MIKKGLVRLPILDESLAILQMLWMSGVTFISGFYVSPLLGALDYDFAAEDI
ncbi:MAG: hypothetical protein VX745_04205 [Pseudomonadota bacterium]|nr:hypothetical protein [Pseudomonadota bacterium]